MAFTDTITKRDATAKSRIHTGTFESDSGSTGGDIETGLEKVTHMTFTVSAAAKVETRLILSWGWNP